MKTGWTMACALLLLSTPALGGGRLVATGGVSQIEGAAGGGLSPWALIAGTGTSREIGATAFVTHLDISDFRLTAAGVGVGIYDRFELSFARQRLGLGTTVPGASIEQDIVGVKLRLAGDAVYDQDRWLPQLAIGAQYKHNRDFAAVPAALGARRDSDTDLYVSATKLFIDGPLGRSLLLNGTLRGTRANQMGLLGFGGDLGDRMELQVEASAAWLLRDNLAVGAEYRQKPSNLSVFPEDDYRDVFLAWWPNKHVSFTLAHAWLGTVADKADQRASYLSVQFAY
ncbi:MAG: hypothetical protein B7Y26_12505 [Hydrogenophilales bacterium 16-64-46]|nr:MAG: hypothetical protein B7Z32_06540 [Hydrogenophilales bacterium 12-64-13]OYZ04246.1 MAG: hypothetical protein B7Y26_12505 [Hydrogenophilales bacterium 16-64-46]OZA38546.1 MAG: hypothetical protein B7X87_08665 [Hydrogenophilales bacterium 17-64-34]HQT00200.1 DUF3034 family protein [Thiobacillus sp.]